MIKVFMLKQKLKIRPYSKRLGLFAMTAALLLSAGIYSGLVRADQFDQQIQDLQQQNVSNKQASDALAAQATSYQDAVDKLASQINSIQQAIVATQKQSDELQKEIDANQLELDHQKQVLGVNIKTMYLEGKISTLEILASSKDLSDFVDKQQYRNAVQSKVKTSVDKITELKDKLQQQQQQLQVYIKEQQAQQDQLAADEAHQSQLLAYTEGQKAAYDQQIKSNQSKIADLRKQQAILNSRYNIGAPLAGDPNHGGYPSLWSSAPQDSMLDYWGMYNRECVSYTAFKVHQDYMDGKNNRDMPYWGGIGNANQWDDNARASGIPVDNNPTTGSIAISNSGTWGHAMYVEQVSTINGQQAIYVSQYNAGLDGQYSEGWRYTTGLVFLHF
jgi:surface antigen